MDSSVRIYLEIRKRREGEDGMESNLGRKLTECYADKRKEAIQAGWRTAFCILLDIANFGGIAAIRRWGEVPPEMTTVIVNLLLTVVFGLYPLIHLKKYLAFYENGMIYGKRQYLWADLGTPGWRDHTTGGFFHSTMMVTDKRNFDVTYLDSPKKEYNRAYMKH